MNFRENNCQEQQPLVGENSSGKADSGSNKKLMELAGVAPGHRSGFVLIAGPANAGKSTLLNALIGTKVSIVSAKQQTTRNRIIGVSNSEASQTIFIDTPGFLSRKHKGELSRFISRSLNDSIGEGDMTMLVVDGSRLASESNLIVRLRSSLKERKLRFPSIVVINKIDLIPDRTQLLPLIQGLSEMFAELAEGSLAGDSVTGGSFVAPQMIPVSALKKEGLAELERALSAGLPEGPPYFPKDIVTDQPEAFLTTEIIREQLFKQLNQELPYSVAVQIEKWEEKPKILHIGAVIFVERLQQRKIVIGQGGAKLKSIGSSARRELETRFGVKVFLELFVKIEADWTKTRAGLERAGYITD